MVSATGSIGISLKDSQKRSDGKKLLSMKLAELFVLDWILFTIIIVARVLFTK
jgi:hypothetical protein